MFEIPHDGNSVQVYDKLKLALEDHNVKIDNINTLERIPTHAAQLWSWIDPPNLKHPSADLEHMQGNDSTFHLPFEVRYQLEVCISRGIINEYNIEKDFIKKLEEIASQDPAKACNILEYVAGQDNRIYDPMLIFEDNEAMAFTAKTEIPHYCAYSRKATITPSTIYFSTPTVETTNRVLRHYARENREGRFLRVQFTDELAEAGDPSRHLR